MELCDLKDRLDELYNNKSEFSMEDYYTEQDHVEFLNETHEPISFLGLEYQAGNVAKRLDYPAFRESYYNTLDSKSPEDFLVYREILEEIEEIEEQIKELED